MSQYAEKLVRARTHKFCDNTYARCNSIQAGDQYVRCVAFPGDVNSSDRPWVMRICIPCWREHDETKPLPGITGVNDPSRVVGLLHAHPRVRGAIALADIVDEAVRWAA